MDEGALRIAAPQFGRWVRVNQLSIVLMCSTMYMRATTVPTGAIMASISEIPSIHAG